MNRTFNFYFQNISLLNVFISAQVEIVAVTELIEIFRRSFSYCDFVNPRGLNFIIRALMSNVEKFINPHILKCPFKKGYFKAYVFTEREKMKVAIPAPPFMKLGQRLDVSIIIRSILDKRKEILCSVFLHLVIIK